MKKLLGLGLLLGSLVGLTGCGESNTINFVTEGGFAPYEYYDDSNNLVGIDIDIAYAIGDYLEMDVKITDTDFDGGLAGTATGKYDAMIAGLTVTEERKKTFNFTDSYADAGLYLVVAEDETITATTYEELVVEIADFILGAQLGNTGFDFIEDELNKTAESYSKFALAAEDLKSGKIDGIIMDNYPAEELVKNVDGLKIIDIQLTEEQYAIAVNKDLTDLHTKINDALAALIKDGTIDKIKAKYIETE